MPARFLSGFGKRSEKRIPSGLTTMGRIRVVCKTPFEPSRILLPRTFARSVRIGHQTGWKPMRFWFPAVGRWRESTLSARPGTNGRRK